MKKIILFIALLAFPGWGQILQVQPTSLAFGTVKVNGSSTMTVTIRNNDSNDLIITDITTNDPVFTENLSTPITLEENETEDIDVTFTPTAAQAYTALLRIVSNAPSSVDEIPLTGTGETPQISISPDPGNFPNGIVNLGNGPPIDFTITNTGDVDLVLNSSTITGANSGSFQITSGNITSNTTITPGNDRTITVEFLPQSAGALTAVLDIGHDAPTPGSNSTINLNGTGEDRTITLIPGSVMFPDTKVNEQSSPINLVVQNTGDVDIAISTVGFAGANPDDYIIVDNGGLTNGSTLPSGQSRVVQIAFQPQASGPRPAVFRVTNNSTNLPTLDGGLSGTGTAPAISAAPSPLAFGNVVLFVTETRVLTITNFGNAALVISNIVLATPSGTDFVITAGGGPLNVTLDPGEDYPVTVSFTPQTRTAQSNAVVISSDDPNNATFEVDVSGTGIAPEIGVSPSPLEFGSIVVGSQICRQLTISNTGNTTLSGQITSNSTEFIVNGGAAYTVPVGGSIQKNICFAPVNPPGDRSATLSLTHNDVTQTSPLTVPMTGRALKDDPVLLPASAQFGPVLINTVSDTIEFELSNSNESEPVTVNDVSITGDSFNSFEIVEGNVSNFPLGIGESLIIKIVFSESNVRFNRATLEVDVDRPASLGGDKIYPAELTGRGVKPTIRITPGAIAFDTTAVGDSKIMGTTISNIGGYPLTISGFPIDGGSGSAFQVIDNPPSSPLDSAETFFVRVEFTPADTVQYADVLRIANDDPNNSNASVSLSGEGFLRDCAVSEVNFSSPFSIGQPATVTATVLRGQGISQVTATLRFARTSDDAFGTASMSETTPGSGVYSGTIPGNVIGLAGVKFFVSLACDNLPIVNSDTYFANVRIAESSSLPTAGNLTTDRWFMWSVPANLDQASIGEVLRALGPEGQETWRIFRVNQNGSRLASDYHDKAALDGRGEYGRFVPGNAFWLYLLKTESDFPTLSALTTVDMQQSYDVTLHPGWNQVGSPYPFNITWNNNVEVPAGADLAIHYRSRPPTSEGWTDLWNSDSPGVDFTLEPWEGYAINNRGTTPVTIRFYADGIPASAAPANSAEAIDWLLVLHAESNGFAARTAVGSATDANAEVDRYDNAVPPVMTEDDVQMYFARPQWQVDATRFASDFRPVDSQGGQWPLTIFSPSGAAVLSSFEKIALPSNFSAMLVDRKYGETYQLQENREIILSQLLADETDRFMILVGTDEYLNNTVAEIDLTVPSAFKLWQNYPNPFNPETTMAFQLTGESHVLLTIYNVLGQRVKTLINEQRPAGAYRLSWDGTDESGRQTVSGVYFYRLEAQGKNEIRKMLKIQ